jgi:periplasmic divalent cation tolerance protein
MSDEFQPILVTCSFPDAASAHAAAKELLEAKLAACVTLVPDVESQYHWQGKLESSLENLAHIKTSAPLFEQVRTLIRSSHPYEVPEIIATEVKHIDTDYARWMQDSLKPD